MSFCISYFTPWRTRCGIRDYSAYLLSALHALPEMGEIQIVEAPENSVRSGAAGAMRHYIADTRTFRLLGAQMNAGGAQLAHVQHQYFFFGGVAPHKTHIRAFLDAIHVPLVMTVHEIAMPEPRASPVQKSALLLANRLNFLHPALRAILLHTRTDRDRLATLGVPPERLHVITHGIPAVPPLPDVQSARQAWGLEGRRVLTLFGFLSTKKGHRLAIEALRHLPEEVVLLFAGDQHPDDHTDYVPSLRAAIQSSGLEDRVRITGYLSEESVLQVLAATDIALAPYLHTSGSGSLALLLASGRAILASDIPPHQDIAAEEPGCLELFRTGDPEALAAQIQTLFKEPKRRICLQAAALAYAARHSYAQMAVETVNIYRQVLAVT